jgi:acyl-CoA synthetase (AMP-forming)/AMP-acid ligase II
MASPGGLSGFLKFYDANPEFRSGFEVIVAGGSLMQRSLSERVRARLCSNLICSYGTTETSTISSAPAHMLNGVAGAVGHILPGVSLRIVGEAGIPLPPRNEGQVWVKTPVSVSGYLGDSGQSQDAFHDGYFDTGDIGYLTQDRMLVISGRKKEILNLGGDKVSPHIIEEAIAAFRGIREAGAFSVQNDLGVEEVWACIVHGETIDQEALQKHCRDRLSQTHVPVRFISVPELPRNVNGKPHRQRLVAMAQELAIAGR